MSLPLRILATLIALLAVFNQRSSADGAGAEVVAFIGGEAVGVAVESGDYEVALAQALPESRLRFRCLAWEGDTVFEQRRDLNYPTLEAQLEKFGAEIVVAQFGEMESLAGESGLDAFLSSYGTLIDRLQAGKKRRFFLLAPFTAPARSDAEWQRHETGRQLYTAGIRRLAEERGWGFVEAIEVRPTDLWRMEDRVEAREQSFARTARVLAQAVSGKVVLDRNPEIAVRWQPLQVLIQEKNRLWFHYVRPQNWAFLNGDRTVQPSSRDHLDPSKRWFPAEMEQFVPLIEAKEKEIDALAVKLSQP